MKKLSLAADLTTMAMTIIAVLSALAYYLSLIQASLVAYILTFIAIILITSFIFLWVITI